MTKKQKAKAEAIHREVGNIAPGSRTQEQQRRMTWADKLILQPSHRRTVTSLK